MFRVAESRKLGHPPCGKSIVPAYCAPPSELMIAIAIV
jgi:hypothetical protein